MPNPLSTTFDTGPAQAVAITLDAVALARKRAKDRLAERMSEARELEKYGNKVMKVKLAALTAIGADVVKMGIKDLGHGKIAVSGDTAHVLVDYLVDCVREYRSSDRSPSLESITAAMKQIGVFNQQLMDSGKAHIEADKQAVGSNTGTHVTFPFPAGTPMVIGIAPNKALN